MVARQEVVLLTVISEGEGFHRLVSSGSWTPYGWSRGFRDLNETKIRVNGKKPRVGDFIEMTDTGFSLEVVEATVLRECLNGSPIDDIYLGLFRVMTTLGGSTRFFKWEYPGDEQVRLPEPLVFRLKINGVWEIGGGNKTA